MILLELTDEGWRILPAWGRPLTVERRAASGLNA
jgi:hypothetical protein